MTKVNVLVELSSTRNEAFELHSSSASAGFDSVNEGERLLSNLKGFGLEVSDDIPPVPMFSNGNKNLQAFSAFSSSELNDDMESTSTVVSCRVEKNKLSALDDRDDITVWPNSELKLMENCDCAKPPLAETSHESVFDAADSSYGVDCRPFRAGVSVSQIRKLLGVERVWADGFKGQNMVVGILDEGVNGEVYPVVGGFSRDNAARQPGEAPVTSHGSMCAADILVAAPAAKIYDYPFLGVANSGGAINMFQAVLNQRRIDGTPNLTNNSYGFVARPPQNLYPRHEVWDSNHPVHRKVREVVASGCACFFAAGNCGANCPSGVCRSSGIGPGKSIHASNSLEEVITVAAVNSFHERVGYSSQGPGGFKKHKPDVSAYTHFFGNFGPGRPGGTSQPYDNGTSAATPVAAGVAALLLSAFPNLTPDEIKQILINGAYNIGAPGWDADTGAGVINAAASYSMCIR